MSPFSELVRPRRLEPRPFPEKDALRDREGHAAEIAEPAEPCGGDSTAEDWAAAFDAADEAMWEVFLADDELEPLPEPGDFD